MNSIISVSEARKILGDKANDMSDGEIINTIHTLNILARDTLKTVQEVRRDDASALANLIYDIYKDKREYINENL